jgi:hypothetical protein
MGWLGPGWTHQHSFTLIPASLHCLWQEWYRTAAFTTTCQEETTTSATSPTQAQASITTTSTQATRQRQPEPCTTLPISAPGPHRLLTSKVSCMVDC